MAEGTKETKTHVEGNNNVVDNFAGRDMFININNRHYKPEFFSPRLDDYDDDKYICPVITPTLVNQTLKDGFLLLGGAGYDKSALARHIAWKVHKRFTGCTISAAEWASSANPQNLELHIQKEKDPTIFILPNISPPHVDHNLNLLYKTARRNRHFVIITSNTSIEKWKLENEVKHLAWQPSATEPLYGDRELTIILLKKLNASSKTLPAQLKNKTFTATTALIGNRVIKDIAIQLKTPESIEIFVKSLVSINIPLNESAVQEIMDNCQNDARAIRQWFYRSLSPREQLIAIGFCLLDGVYDDQFFAAMEALVEHSWHRRESSLRCLDYVDLDGLSNYYRLIPMGQTGLKRVESHLTEQRQILLETIWDSHRRQIFSALPVLEDLVRHSVATQVVNQELFGTTRRCRQLRDVISETFCNIGLKPKASIKGSALEDTLLRLAAEKNIGVQAVVARAMARWRFYGQDDKLFDTLKRWQENKTWKIIQFFLDKNEIENQQSPPVYLKATIALAVGFAALYDPPNQMNTKLCDLLNQLAQETDNRFIRIRFANYTLPLVARFHLSQLKDSFCKLAENELLNEPIGASLAAVIQEGVKEAVTILDKWFQRCNNERPTRYKKGNTTPRDNIMATVAYAYGWLQYNNDNSNLIDPLQGFKRLQYILENESSPHVRKACIVSIIRQLSSNFEKVEHHLKLLFSKMYPEERTIFVNKLAEFHMQQRVDLENGQANFTWRDNSYPVWLTRPRPLTAIEAIMKKWLKEGNAQRAAQVALEFEISDLVIDFEEQEEKFINKQKEKQAIIDQSNPQNNTRLTRPIFASSEENDGVTTFISWLLSITQPRYRAKIKSMLPIILKKNWEQDRITFALKKLYKYSDRELEMLSDKLTTAIFLAGKKDILIPSAAGALVLLTVILYFIF